MNFTFEGQISIGDAHLDADIQGFDSVELAAGSFLYASTGQNGGLIAYRLVDGALAQVVDQELFSTSSSAVASGLVSCVSVGGSLQLIFGGSTSADLVSYSISNNGQMSTLSQIGDIISGTMKISAVAAIETSNGTVLYVVDEGTDQLTAYMPDGAGGYTSQTAQGDSSQYAITGPAELETVTVGGHDFLLATDHASNGVFSYQVDATTGVLQQKGYAGASGGLGVSAPTAVETVTAFGQTWVILGAAGSSSISVMQIDVTGELQPVDHMIDTLNTRFGGVQALGVVQSDDQVFVVAGGSDDGLSLFTLLPDGRLIHLQTIPHTTGAGLMNIENISATIVGGEIQIFVSSSTAEGVAQYSISLADIGDTTLDQSTGANILNGTSGDDLIVAGTGGTDTIYGGSGDDILVGGTADVVMWGGAGADRFIVHSGTYTTQIMDFEAGIDLIDLSDFTMLRSVGQLTVTTTSYGALVTVQGAVIEVHSAGGGGLDLEDIFGAEFSWPDHILVLFDNIGQVMIGTDGNDSLEGSEDNDTIVGGLGNDNLVGGAGDDGLQGGAGDDFVFGNDGDDLMEGGDGHDTLYGGAGNDVIHGGAGDDWIGASSGDDELYGNDGDDEIWADVGNDLVYGGAGNDVMGGGGGNDVMYGEAGDDEVWSGAGNDIVHGGAGHDILGGRDGHDQLFGGDGNDTIWCNTGDDVAYGGAGDDTLGGSNGNDTLYGDAGDDFLSGGSDNDWLSGGADNDTLLGGGGNDIFYFELNQGNDQISDFDSSQDSIHISGSNLNFNSLNMSQNGNNVVIALGSGQITLLDTGLGDLSAGDFVFL